MDLYTRLLTTAKLHLIHNEYRCSLSTCLHGLEVLKNTEQGQILIINEPTVDLDYKIGFGILAIQSLALDNQWTEVKSFVEEWFGQVISLPAEILQICACLHLHKHDYQPALNIAEEWLQNKQNHCQHGFEHVVELYIRHILLPIQHTKKAKDFLQNCTNISEHRMQSLSLYIERSQPTITSDQGCSGESPRSKSCVQPKQAKGGSFSLLLKIIKLCATTRQALSRVSLRTTLKTGARLVVLLYFLYAVIVRTEFPGDIFRRGSGPVLFWNAIKQAWRALFAPYHLVPK